MRINGARANMLVLRSEIRNVFDMSWPHGGPKPRIGPQIAQRYYYCAIRHGHMGVRVGACVRVCYVFCVCVCVCSHLMCTYYYYYIIGVRRCCDGAAASADRPFGSRHSKQIAIDLFAGAPDTMRSRSRGRGRERIALLWVMVVVVVIKNSHCGLMAL